VAAALGLAVVEHLGDQEVGVEGDDGDGGEHGEAEHPPHPAERVRQRQHRRPHDRRGQVETGVPPRPCTVLPRDQITVPIFDEIHQQGEVPFDSSTKAAPGGVVDGHRRGAPRHGRQQERRAAGASHTVLLLLLANLVLAAAKVYGMQSQPFDFCAAIYCHWQLKQRVLKNIYGIFFSTEIARDLLLFPPEIGLESCS
jgi:hypothetical protein